MSGVERHTVTSLESDQRLDRWFKQNHPELPFGKLQKLFRTGQVRLDGKRVKGSDLGDLQSRILVQLERALETTAG